VFETNEPHAEVSRSRTFQRSPGLTMTQ